MACSSSPLIFACPDRERAQQNLYRWLAYCADANIPELSRLARTIDSWRPELLAYFDTGGVSNGPTEAVNALIKKVKRVSVNRPSVTGLAEAAGGPRLGLAAGRHSCPGRGCAMLRVSRAGGGDGHVLDDGSGGADVDVANRFLVRLTTRNFSPATRRAYAYDLLSLLRFCDERDLRLAEVRTTDVFDYLEWQAAPRLNGQGRVVVRLSDRRGAAPATMNRGVAAARGLFEFACVTGARSDNPVPAARRSSGARVRRGLLGHLGPGRARGGGRLVRTPRRLPESLEADEVSSPISAPPATARSRC